MKNINKILNEITEAEKTLNPRSKELNPDKWHITYHNAYNPQNKKPIVSPANKHLWETTVKDHNDSYIVFMFKTTDIYGSFRGAGTGNLTEKEHILKTSETRKVFYKHQGVEVGLTIEHTLRNPTDTCWGYSWGKPDYYIIKDGKLTITERRSVIRKIYNGIDHETETYLIKFDYPYLKSITGELEEINELAEKVWLVTVEGKEYILSNDDKLWDWICDIYKDENYYEWWVKELGGINDVIKTLLSGSFDYTKYLYHSYELEDLLPYCVKKDTQRAEVLHSSWDFDNEARLEGLKVYEIE